ncbi:uncharacterized protein LOC113496609 isoform X2 [Trichoplusia ni]|nr:uncharacterized protein LOC113496609 isoform X2 [Trichoplusia ni]
MNLNQYAALLLLYLHTRSARTLPFVDTQSEYLSRRTVRKRTCLNKILCVYVSQFRDNKNWSRRQFRAFSYAAHGRSGESLLKKKNHRGTAENAGDAAGARPESLIPTQSRTADAMSELARAAEPLLPPLALAALVACVAGAAALANCSILAALFKTSRSGLLTIILQLAIADFILGATIGPELWSFNTRSWVFGDPGCVAYRGLNVFASTASSYLVATIALHSLATINIEEKAITKRIKRSEQDEDEEIRSSRHSLVTSSDFSTPPRTMNLDYRLGDHRISVAQPSIFVWVLAISLSVPEFVLATTVHLDQNVVVCTIVDTSQRLHMYSILAVFNLFLPLLIMGTAGVLVIIKLKLKKLLSQIECFESIAALKLSLWLIVVYMFLCTPRSVVTAYNIYSKSMQGNVTSLVQDNDTAVVNIATSGAYIVSTLVRPLLSITLLPHVRKLFSFGSYTQTDNV